MKFFHVHQFFIIVLIVFVIANISESSTILQGSPPARIGGSLTVDGNTVTQQNASGYTFVVTKEDSSAYVPTPQYVGLNSSDWYLIDIPIYHAAMEPGGANPGETAVIHAFKDGTELVIVSPNNGTISVGQSGSSTQVDLVTYLPVAPANIYGSLTVNGVNITQSIATGYSIIVTRQNGNTYTPQAICNSLDTSDYYSIDIPLYHNVLQTDAANVGETGILHIFKDGIEMEILSPVNGELIVGQSGSITRIDLDVQAPFQEILGGPAAGTVINISKGNFDGGVMSITDQSGNAPATFPLGLIDFAVTGISNGDDLTVTFVAPINLPTSCKYYKYINGNFIQYDQAYGLSDGDNQFSIVLVDGGNGDDDSLANGRISDPGGPGIPLGTTTDVKACSVPTLSEIGMIMFIILIVLTGITANRKFSLPTFAKLK
jgi:hypothetical protein